jgi:hypothetical protein
MDIHEKIDLGYLSRGYSFVLRGKTEVVVAIHLLSITVDPLEKQTIVNE